MPGLELEKIEVRKPQGVNIIIGQAHFIKTVEDLYEALVGAVPEIKFGLAFCESSGKALVRRAGTDKGLVEIAADNALRIGCGHSFIIILGNAYPINVLNQIKMVPEVCRIFCATANDVEIIVAKTQQGRALLGVVDGIAPAGVEQDEDIAWRKNILREFKYKI